MREAYRLNKTILTASGKTGAVELALIYSTKEVHDYKTIENAVKRVLNLVAEGL